MGLLYSKRQYFPFCWDVLCAACLLTTFSDSVHPECENELCPMQSK